MEKNTQITESFTEVIEFLEEMVSEFKSELKQIEMVNELAKSIEMEIPSDIQDYIEKTETLTIQTMEMIHKLKGILFAKFDVSLFPEDFTNHLMEMKNLFAKNASEEEISEKVSEFESIFGNKSNDPIS